MKIQVCFSPDEPSGLLVDHTSIFIDVPLFATYAALTSKIQNREAGILVKLDRSEPKLSLDLFQYRCPNRDVLAPTAKPQWPSQIRSAQARVENLAQATGFRCNCAGIVQVRKSKLSFSVSPGVLSTTQMTLTLHNDVSRQDSRRKALPPSRPN